MKTPRYILILILCLSLLSSCATNTSPTATTATTQVASMCASVGSTHVYQAASSLPAVQGDWPMFRGDLMRSGAARDNGGSKLTLAWSYCRGGTISSSPVVNNGIVYSASLDQTLSALDIHSGKMLWQVHASDAFYSTPIVQNGMVYAAALNGLYSIDAKSGHVHWYMPVETKGARFWSSPVVTHGLVIIGMASNLSEQPKIAGRVLAFDAQTGQVRWRTYTLAQAIAGGGVWSSPAIDEARGIAYLATGDPDDGVQALALNNGHVLWHWRSITKDVSDTDIGAGPLLYRDQQGRLHVVVGGKNGIIYNLDATNGQVLWHTQLGEHIYSSPAFFNGILYTVGTIQNKRAVSIALDAQTGNIRWQHAIATMVYASPVIAGQTLYQAIGNGFGSGDGGIEVINAANGQLLQYMDMHSTSNSSPAVLPAWLLVGAHNGDLYAFTRSMH